MIAASSYTTGPVQADGRWNVTERHESTDGQIYSYEYLSDGALDPQMVMEERAAVINATLAAREAARVAVVGTEVPYNKYDFIDRFTPLEYDAIEKGAATDPNLKFFLLKLNASGGVYMTLARPGINYCASVGKITAERAAVIGAE